MSKNLERFVRDNRFAFDTDKPSEKSWQAIEKELENLSPQKKVRSLKFFLMAAAAVLLIVGTTYTWFLFTSKTEYQEASVPVNGNGYIAALDPSYAAELNKFTALIDEKQSELKSLQTDNPTLYQKFNSDIQKLDSTYGLLKNQLPVNPNKEELLQAMIWNLQLQIELLNQQLNIIQKIKHSNSHSL